jgi:peptidyl-prolyl cis-trans isomerase C
MKNQLAFSALAAILALSGCQSKKSQFSEIELFPAPTEGKIVAEFDNVKITDTYLSTFLKDLPPHVMARYNTPEKRERLISRILEGEVLTRAAFRKGITNDPALLTRIKAVIAQHYMRKVIKPGAERSIKVSEEEMKAYYEKNKAKYGRPAKRRASHILVKVFKKAPKAEQDRALTRIKKILKDVKKASGDPKVFARLAEKYSDDQGSKRRGGDVGFFSRVEKGGRMAKAFTNAAFALAKKGDVSDVVRSRFGYHIIRLTEKRDAALKTYDEVKPRIESALKARHRKTAYKSAIEDVKKAFKFQVNKEAIAGIDFSIPKDIRLRLKPPLPK